MSTTLPHGIIQINEGNIAWYGDITANWQLIDSKIGIYDAAIATIPAPANNGTLTINYGGATIAMFGADDAGNVTADIPAPGDGTLTVTQGGSTLGTFSANQATPETIDIPAPGDGTLTIQLNGTDVQTFTANQSGNATANIVTPAINNGTLTIRLNGVDVQTFTANQANDVVADIIPPVPGDGTLTIKVNGSTAGTFTANQSTAATANITVPTAVSELTNDSGYLTSSSNLDASKLTSGTVDIARLPQGALERLVKVANEAARYALTTADVQLGDTVQQLDTGIMYVVTDTDHLDSAAGYTEYTAGTAASVPWSGVTGKPAFATVATSGSYNDLSNKPTIPTVNNATLTIQKNGTTVKTFTANASSNVTANISVPTKTSDLTNDSGFLTSADRLPIGSYIPFAGSQAPAGFLVCNGGAISRTTYSALFAVIGTKYGSGNGSTTFNLPNLTDRFLQGSTTSGTVINAGLPNITGQIYASAHSAEEQQGAFKVDNLDSSTYAGGGAYFWDWSFDASRSSSIYGNSSTVQPPALTCLICIKY